MAGCLLRLPNERSLQHVFLLGHCLLLCPLHCLLLQLHLTRNNVMKFSPRAKQETADGVESFTAAADGWLAWRHGDADLSAKQSMMLVVFPQNRGERAAGGTGECLT